MWRRADLDHFLGGAPAFGVVGMDLAVTRPRTSSRISFGELITHVVGVDVVCRVGMSISKGELAPLIAAHLLVIEDFDPRRVNALGSTVLERRRRLGNPTVLVAQAPPSTWAELARSPRVRRAVQGFLALAHLVGLPSP